MSYSVAENSTEPQGHPQVNFTEGAPVTPSHLFHEISDTPTASLQQHHMGNEDAPMVIKDWKANLSYFSTWSYASLGFGVLWRFPSLCYIHGGGIFLIPYVVCLLVISLPFLQLEMLLGQQSHTSGGGSRSHVQILKQLNSKLTGVGSIGVLFGLLLAGYYSVINSWAIVYLVNSFKDPLPFSTMGGDHRETCRSLRLDTNVFFYSKVTGLYERIEKNSNGERLRDVCLKTSPLDENVAYEPNLIFASLFLWVIIFVASSCGRKATPRSPLVFYAIMWLLLWIAFWITCSMDGSKNGFDIYFKNWQWRQLNDGKIWFDAATQAIMSIGLSFGFVTTLTSYNNVNEPIVHNSWWILLANAFTSFFVSMTSFGVLGSMAFEARSPSIYNTQVVAQPLGVFFTAYSRAFAHIDGPNFFCIIFFAMMMILGIQTLYFMVFSLVRTLRKTEKSNCLATFFVCLLGFSVSSIFAQENGLYWMDLFDHFLSVYTLLPLFLCLSIGVAWVYDFNRCKRIIGANSANLHALTTFIAALVWVMVAVFAPKEVKRSHSADSIGQWLFWGFLLSFLILIIGWSISFQHSYQRIDPATWFHTLFLDCSGRDFIEAIHKKSSIDRSSEHNRVSNCFAYVMTRYWSLMMKYVLPLLLAFLVCISLRRDAYYSYPTPLYNSYPSRMISVGWIMSVFGIVWMVIPLMFFANRTSDDHEIPSAISMESYEHTPEIILEDDISQGPVKAKVCGI